MADTAIDSRIVEILNRLESIETTMNQYKGSKEKEGAIDNYKKDNKHRLRADLSDLKSRLAALNDSDDSDSVDDADDADVADNASDSSSVCGIPEDIVQRLNRVNWTQFKNHVVGDDSYIIDVLIGPVKSHWHIRQEKANLPQTGVDETKLGTGPIVGKPADQGAPTVEKERTESQPELPERIRINGSNLSQTLLDVAGMVNRDRDYFHFIRPYKLLIRHEKALRGRFLKLLALREKSLREVVQEQPSTESNQFDVANGEIGFDVDITSTQNTELIVYPDVEIDEREFHGLECLLGFMDTYLMPVYERYRSATAKKIRFSDLWYLYRPGDLVVMRNESKKKGLHHTTTSQVQPNLCRVLSVSRGRANLDTLHGSEDATRPPVVKIHNFRIQGYTIAYDGTSLGPVRQVFEIAPFQGEKDINALDPCPLRYVEGSESLESALVERGEKFLQYMEPSHCRYTGPTYSEHQIGFPCSIAEKHTTIDGYVIVDFKEARQEDDEWVLDHGIIPADTGAVSEVKEYHSRSIWHDKEHTKLKTTWFDDIYDDDHVDVDGQEEFVMSNAFLTAWRHSRGKPVSREKLERIDHALLPNRVVGYDLYRHKFSILALDYLQPVRANTDGWADLKLPRGHKSIVQAQIRTHFLRKMTRQSHGSESTDIDLVRGKGLGLVILLHGAPGVGKTSTVECVAESLGKPLYPITCGDLGTTPEHVEETLARTFAKTEAWDCVLLLDEADVFLAQRTRTDLNRNAIVSVFLRVLEYYKGTLILTTNRVGAFDEAFKSRIHLKLYYPALDKVQTLAIWKMNLERIITRKKGRLTADIPEILSFANQLFEQQNKNNAEWNGRQIRNAFQTALAMAEYEALGDSGLTADWELLEKINSRLEVRHLKVVADASAQFDDYIEETIGGNDAARARHDRERADHIKWYVNPQSESGPPQWTFNTTGPQTSGSFASPPGFKQSGMTFNAQKEPRSGQWPSNSPGPPEGSYQPANADPFASSSAYQQNMFFASQKAASAKTTFQQGASWTSPQQPWAGMGSSPARPSQESEGPNPYMLNATAPAGWSHMKDEREYGHQNPSFNQFDGGRQGAPSTPSNRDQRPNLHTPVGMGAAQSQDDDGY